MHQDKPTDLAEFQKAYSAHIRSPSTVACPEGIPKRRSRVYEDLLFNNTKGFVEKCFPVSQSLFTQQQWLHLAQQFFKNWPCHTPYFSEIPYEFVQFINTNPKVDDALFAQGLPKWLSSLLHYEWIELEVELSQETVLDGSVQLTKENIEQTLLTTNATLMNAQYDWPVHQISTDFIPQEPKPTCLLIYRVQDHTVRFMEINAITSSLVSQFEQKPCRSETALRQVCKLASGLSLEQAYQFGLPLIIELATQQVIFTTESEI